MKKSNKFNFKEFVNNMPEKKKPRDLYSEMNAWIYDFQHSLSEKQNEELNKIRLIADNFDEYENTNNERICKIGDSISEKLYKDLVEDGCCGFYDEEFELSGGIKIRYGFNFGH